LRRVDLRIRLPDPSGGRGRRLLAGRLPVRADRRLWRRLHLGLAPAPRWRPDQPGDRRARAVRAAPAARRPPIGANAHAAIGEPAVPFSYYERLTRAQQRIYRQSDAVTSLRLSDPSSLHPLVDRLAAALTGECAPPGIAGLGPRRPGRADPDRLAVQTAAQA